LNTREEWPGAGVAGGRVAVDVGADRILDLDAGDVRLGAVVAHDHVLRLADIDAGIRSADRGGVLDQHVRALDRVDAVGAVRRLRAAGPLDAHVADRDVRAVVDLQAVALAVLDRQVLEREVVGIDEHALGPGHLVLEREYTFVRPGAADRHAVCAQGQHAAEPMQPRRNLDDGAGLGVEQLLLQALLECAVLGTQTGRFRVTTALIACRNGNAKPRKYKSAHRVPLSFIELV